MLAKTELGVQKKILTTNTGNPEDDFKLIFFFLLQGHGSRVNIRYQGSWGKKNRDEWITNALPRENS